MTKVMLINPPRKDYDKSSGFTVYFPIGLLSIAAMIKNICEVKIFDCSITDFEIQQEKDYVLYGTSFKNIKETIKNFNPDIVGISIPFSTQSGNAIAILNICKKINPKIIVVFGGPDSSARYESLLKETACDYCVIGEGEQTFFEFIKNFNSNIPLTNIDGLAYKNSETVDYKPRKFLDNLDDLPFPAYDLIEMEAYLKNKYLYKNRSLIKNSISIITSRGCPYDCIFCAIKLHMGKKYRYNSPTYVINHLKLLINEYKITNFHFEDDNFSLNAHRFNEILDKIIKDKLNLKWDTPNGIRADTLDFNLLKKIKKSGCKKLTIAIESGNQDVLDKIIKKRISLDSMLEIVKYCKKLKINTGSFYVIGFPGESIENMKETANLALKLLRKYDVLPCLLVAIPFHGTELYNICIKNGFIQENLDEIDFAGGSLLYGNPLISTKDFSKEDIKDLTADYFAKLKKELLFYSIKHPVFSIKKINDKLHILNRFFK